MARTLLIVMVLGSVELAAAQEPFEVDSPEPATLSILGIDFAIGWGHAALELDLRWMVLTRAGFLMDVSAGGSWGFAKPGLGVHGDAIIGWAFSWKSAVDDAITTAEYHARVDPVFRVDSYDYVRGTVPARGHFAIIGGARTTLVRGIYDDVFEVETNSYYLRFAAGIELGKSWGSWASRNGHRQFLYGYSGFRAMFLYSPEQGYRMNSDERWSRFGAAFQWIQTTRVGKSRTIFGATVGFEPGAGWLIQGNMTWPIHVRSPE